LYNNNNNNIGALHVVVLFSFLNIAIHCVSQTDNERQTAKSIQTPSIEVYIIYSEKVKKKEKRTDCCWCARLSKTQQQQQKQR
jgi:hypothetical protein